MKIVCVFLFISIVITCYSCSENSTESNPNNISLIPFKLNNYWEYAHIIYDSGGNIIISDSALYKVDKDTFFLNQRYFGYEDSRFYYTNKNDGLWMYELIGDSVKNGIYLKYPCNVGDSYVFIFGRPLNVTVTSLNEKVTVEAGTFSCIQYRFRYTPTSPYSYTYVAPGVGIIKSDGFQESEDSSIYKSWEESLLEYQLN